MMKHCLISSSWVLVQLMEGAQAQLMRRPLVWDWGKAAGEASAGRHWASLQRSTGGVMGAGELLLPRRVSLLD